MLRQFAVHVRGGGGQRRADEIAARHGFVNLGQIGALEDHFLLEHPRDDLVSSVEFGLIFESDLT